MESWRVEAWTTALSDLRTNFILSFVDHCTTLSSTSTLLHQHRRYGSEEAADERQDVRIWTIPPFARRVKNCSMVDPLPLEWFAPLQPSAYIRLPQSCTLSAMARQNVR
jgi:hypothetical protein